MMESTIALGKAKASGMAAGSGILAMLAAKLIENEALIRIFFTIAGGTCAMLASVATIYYVRQNHKMRQKEHDIHIEHSGSFQQINNNKDL